MEMGWRGLMRTVAVTAVVTSALLVVVAGWFFHRHLQRDSERFAEIARSNGDAAIQAAPAVASSAPDAKRHLSMVPPLDTGADTVGALRIPVAGVQRRYLVDTFVQERDAGRRHDAIDIVAPLDTPVIAAASGRVEKLFLSKPGGNTVYVRSPDRRTIYYYAHLSRYAAGLHEGQVLEQGDPVGFVGYSGNADRATPHLHFAIMVTDPAREWYEAATAVNPYPLLVGRLGEPREAVDR